MGLAGPGGWRSLTRRCRTPQQADQAIIEVYSLRLGSDAAGLWTYFNERTLLKFRGPVDGFCFLLFFHQFRAR